MRIIAVGDIHGHNDKLKSILEQIDPQRSDTFVFLGDYIDRGPDSKGVIDTLIEFQDEFVGTVFLTGNHERFLLDALDEHYPEPYPEGWGPTWTFSNSGMYGDCSAFDFWTQNGGWECLESYGVKRDELVNLSDCWDFISPEHIAFFAMSWRYHREYDFLFVHDVAAVNRLPSWDRYTPPEISEIQVVGHTPCPGSEPYFEDTRYNLDTGAGYGRKLTACDVLTKRYWQA